MSWSLTWSLLCGVRSDSVCNSPRLKLLGGFGDTGRLTHSFNIVTTSTPKTCREATLFRFNHWWAGRRGLFSVNQKHRKQNNIIILFQSVQQFLMSTKSSGMFSIVITPLCYVYTFHTVMPVGVFESLNNSFVQNTKSFRNETRAYEWVVVLFTQPISCS